LESFFEKRSGQSETANAPKRERNIEDLVENPILYHALNSITQKGVTLHMNKSELEMLCVAGALMAVIAQADGQIHPDEVETIKVSLQKHWKIGDSAAAIIADIAVNIKVSGMDIHKNCKKFYASTSAEDRMNFVMALIELIKADYEVDPNEIVRLREIATNLRIPPAKLAAIIPALGSIERPPEDEAVGDDDDDDDDIGGFGSFLGRGN
jgi:uncharacterized tellurite resistance protein B-like protein